MEVSRQEAFVAAVAVGADAAAVGACPAADAAVAAAVVGVAAVVGYDVGYYCCHRCFVEAVYCPAVGVAVVAYPVAAAAVAAVFVAARRRGSGYCPRRHLAVVACPVVVCLAAPYLAAVFACRYHHRHFCGRFHAVGRVCACCLFQVFSGLFGQPHQQSHGQLR